MLPFKNRPLLVVDFFVGIAMIEMSCYSGEWQDVKAVGVPACPI